MRCGTAVVMKHCAPCTRCKQRGLPRLVEFGEHVVEQQHGAVAELLLRAVSNVASFNESIAVRTCPCEACALISAPFRNTEKSSRCGPARQNPCSISEGSDLSMRSSSAARISLPAAQQRYLSVERLAARKAGCGCRGPARRCAAKTPAAGG